MRHEKSMLKLLGSLERKFLKYGLAALIMAIPIYPKFPFITIPGSWVAIRLEDFLILAVFLVWSFSLLRVRLAFFKDDINRIIAAYLAIGFLSFFSAVFITHTVVPHISLLHAFRRVEYLVVFFMMVSFIRRKADVVFFSGVIFLTIFIVFLYGLGQKFLGFPAISTMNVEFAKGIALRLTPGARISSTFAGHYDLSAYTVLMLSFTAAWFVAVKKAYQKIFFFVFFLIAFWLLLVSASRISFAAYLGSITITLWLLRRRLWIVPLLALSVTASLFTTSLTERYARSLQVVLLKVETINIKWPFTSEPTKVSFVPPVTPTPPPAPAAVGPVEPVPTVVKKYIPTPTPVPTGKKYVFYGAPVEIHQTEDRSASIRFKVEWPRAIRAFFRNPALGSGFSSITLATDNDYLRALGEVGLLGFIFFMLIFFRIGQRARRLVFGSAPLDFERIIAIGIVGGTTGFLANAFFIDVFEASKVAVTFWLLAGLLIGITNLKTTKRKA